MGDARAFGVIFISPRPWSVFGNWDSPVEMLGLVMRSSYQTVSRGGEIDSG